jgi:hypothetical protein
MTINLTTGKYYNLQFNVEDADADSFIEGIVKLCDNYKLIGNGIIPWDRDNCSTYEYYLFKNCNTNNIIEVYRDGDEYLMLVFYIGDTVTPASYSDYLDYGDVDFPNFGGPHNDILVNVKIKESYSDSQ